MKRKTVSNQSGISLIEVLILLVIIAVLVVFSIAQFGNSEARFQTQNIARALKVNFERARFDSVKRRPSTVNQMSKVVINNATSFSLSTDLNQNGTLEASETKTLDFSGRTDVKIIASGMTFPVTIVFDRRGQIVVTDGSGANVTPIFAICDNCTASTVNASNAFIVSVSPTGTVSMLKKGETLPTLNNPNVTAVSSNTAIDSMVAVQSGGTVSTGTPVPTPTPDPTPSQTPTPTPTPSPTGTASPTPTPVVCQRNERPAQTGCTCQVPMYVRSNGLCK